MRIPRPAATLAVALVTTLFIVPGAEAQGWLNRVKEKAKEKVQQRVDQTTDSVTDAAYDKSEHAVKCVIGDKACIRKAEAAGQSVAVVNAQGQAVSSSDSARAVAAANGGAAASAPTNAAPGAVDPHNDFTPGTDILFQTDFASATLGDFPRNIELQEGNAEIVAVNGQKLLRATSHTVVAIPLPATLPQRFTMEFDYTGGSGWSAEVAFNGPDAPENESGSILFSLVGDSRIVPHAGASSGSAVGDFTKQMIHCAVMADGKYFKIYVNGLRAAQSPNAPMGRFTKIFITLPGDDAEPAFLGNIRVAAGGRDMYEALSTEGRFTTHGILFATGSAAIDPSSATVLTQIGQMLQQHPDLKLEIDGHTDNVGGAAANMTLSDARAASVKQYLVSNFQIDASRLASKGFGASKPISSNATPDGRQQNRRVELVRM